MDSNNNNWRPAQLDPPPNNNNNNMDASVDWRSQLQPDSRHRIVNKIMETLKRHLPFSGDEGLLELQKIAVRFEEKIYSAATSQSDYLRKVSLKMLTMETKSQNTIAGSLTANSSTTSAAARNPMDPTSMESASQSGHASSADWQEEVHKKITVIKEKYLPEIGDMYQNISQKVQQHDSLPQQPISEQFDKLRIFKTMLERIIAFLQVSKMNVTQMHRDRLGNYEKQIVNFLNSNRPRKPGQVPPHMQSMVQSQNMQAQLHENHMNPQLQSANVQSSVMMQQNNSSLQQNQMTSLAGVSNAQQIMIGSIQSGPNIEDGQGGGFASSHQG